MKKTIRNFLFLLVNYILLITSPLWGLVLKTMAKTGLGTDICLKYGFLPMPVHFYSPVPDLSDLEKRKVWQKKSSLAGIDLHPEHQVQLLRELGKNYGQECNWPPKPTLNPIDFFTENNSFSFYCAAGLHTIIRTFHPKKIIEIGSGNSSKVISSALKLNKVDGYSTDYTIIDPYSSRNICKLANVTQIISEKVEVTEIDRFDELEQNDILFIDSSHTVRTGGDVNFLYLEILPRLSPGVIIHIHDIGLPYEYPKVYFTNPSFRVFWTEAYLLQAFLSLNPHYEIMLAMSYLTENHFEELIQAFPYSDPEVHKATSGSFWIRRVS